MSGSNSSLSSEVIMMQPLIRFAVKDPASLEDLTDILIGVCPNEKQQFAPLEVIIQVDDNDHWKSKQPDLLQRRQIMANAMRTTAKTIGQRFDTSKDNNDLDIIISLFRKEAELVPKTDEDYPGVLTNLAKAIENRFDYVGEPADLDLIVGILGTVLATCGPPLHPFDPMHLSNLADAFGKRYNTIHKKDDLDITIDLRRKLVQVTRPNPLPDVDHIDALRCLSQVLSIRYRHYNHEEDLEESLELQRRALAFGYVAVDDEAALTKYLQELGRILYVRFRARKTADEEELIEIYEDLAQKEQEDGSETEETFSRLAALLNDRFNRLGDVDDLDRARSLQTRLLEMVTKDHPDRCHTLTSLGSMLRSQYIQTGRRESLDEGAALLRQALELVPFPHQDRARVLNQLSLILRTLFDECDEYEYLQEAIGLQEEALKLDPSKETRISILSNHAAALWSQYDPSTGSVAEVDEIIALQEKALDEMTETHSSYPACLANLGNSLRARFAKTKDHDDLDKSIEYLQKSSIAIGERHLDSFTVSFNLGLARYQKYYVSKDSKDLNEAATTLRAVSQHPGASLSQKFAAAKSWAETGDSVDCPSVLEAYRTAIGLLMSLMAVDVPVELRQQRLLSKFARPDGLALAAAGAAIKAGMLKEAIDFLEEGRAVFWGQAMKLKTPITDLELAHPELAAQFIDLSKKLEFSAFGARQLDSEIGPKFAALSTSPQQDSKIIRQINAKWDDLLRAIRSKPEFDRFLQPYRHSSIANCPLEGPVIMLCVRRKNGGAIIMSGNKADYLPLRDVNLDKISTLANLVESISLSDNSRDIDELSESAYGKVKGLYRTNPGLEEILENEEYRAKKQLSGALAPSTTSVLRHVLKELWVTIGQPIIEALKLQQSQPSLRVYWCSTGPATFLPIHAAGIYDVSSSKSESLLDYMVSSYVPTLGALIKTFEFRPSEDPIRQEILAVVQPQSLPAAREELGKIEKRLASQPPRNLVTVGNTPSNPATVGAVLQHLATASIVHFACHGKQYIGRPLESALLLENGQLTLGQIMQVEMRNARLAFLCACETAMGERDAPDESMHLGGALLFAGFKGVVATMWSIADIDGPKITDEFYGYLVNKQYNTVGGQPRLDTNDAARALHHAVVRLRSEGAPLRRWVPFVYLGR